MGDFWTGGAAAIAAISVMHPVDVVKTRIQVQGEQIRSGSKVEGKPYRGVLRSLWRIGVEEGPRGLYRGLVPAYGLQFSVTATRFGVYGVLKDVLIPDDATENVGPARFILAMLSGGVSALAGNPFYAIKTRAQATTHSQQQHKRGLIHSLRDIYHTEGVKGYWRGVNAFAPRVMAYGAVQLSVYDSTKTYVQEEWNIKEGLKLHIISSFAAALLSVATIQPFDFIAVRLMNQPVDATTGKPLLYNGVIDCTSKVLKQEGPGAFLKGLGANYSRMFPYTVLVFIFFEQFKLLKT